MSNYRVLIVQPYVPAYRVPLFDALYSRLRSLGIDMLVAAGEPQGADAARGDAMTALPWSVSLDQHSIGVFGRRLNWRSVGHTLSSYQPTHIIVEQALHNGDTYEIIAWAQRKSTRVAMWGHGKTYTRKASRFQETLKTFLTRTTSWFFAYTEGGKNYLVARNYPASKITVLNNSTDTDSLRSQLADLQPETVLEFQNIQGISPERSALFLGGLDGRKGIPFLLAAAKQVEREQPGFVLMLGGGGVLIDDLRQQQETGAPIRVLGRLDGIRLATALRSAAVLTVPEWVGLVAADSLASGIPLVTTRHPSHAPEFEYLANHRNCVITEHSVSSYAAGIRSLLADPQRRAELSKNGIEDSRTLTINLMAERFISGITQWISWAQ